MPRVRKPKITRDEWGSITKIANGSWRLRYYGPDGKRRDGGRYPTKAEAEEARSKLRTSILGGTWRQAGPGDSPALSEYVDSYLQRAELNEDLGPATIALYRRQFDRLVLPEVGGIELGQVRIGRLTRETVMAWELAARAAARANAAAHATKGNGAAAARRRGHPARAWATSAGIHAPKTGRLPAAVLRAWETAGSPVAQPVVLEGPASGDRQFEQARTALSAVCTAAVEDGFLLEHPVRMRPGTKARRRQSSRSTRSVRTVSVEVLLQLALHMPPEYGLAALTTTFGGLRGGETFALALRHLRYDSAGVVTHLRIERALVEISGQPVTFGPPKTSAGEREVAIPRQVGELLAEHALSLRGDLDALLFTTATGRVVTRARRSHVLAAARTHVPGSERLTWHGLRHTGLTLAASIPGATIRNIMDRGGHSTPRAALMYQHTAANVDEQLAAGLGLLLEVRTG